MQLPDLHQTILDCAGVDALFHDIDSCTEVIEVIPRYADRRYASEQTLSLNEGRQRLRDGTLQGVQIRYMYEGSQWWDTLMRTPQGVRVVRIEHHFADGATT